MITGRLVCLRDSPLPPPLSRESAWANFDDVPDLLGLVREDYATRGSRNRRSAETLAYALLSHQRTRLLVVAVGEELVLAKQFVSNLKLCLRDLDAEARDSRQFLKARRRTRGRPVKCARSTRPGKKNA